MREEILLFVEIFTKTAEAISKIYFLIHIFRIRRVLNFFGNFLFKNSESILKIVKSKTFKSEIVRKVSVVNFAD